MILLSFSSAGGGGRGEWKDGTLPTPPLLPAAFSAAAAPFWLHRSLLLLVAGVRIPAGVVGGFGFPDGWRVRCRLLLVDGVRPPPALHILPEQERCFWMFEGHSWGEAIQASVGLAALARDSAVVSGVGCC